MEMVLTSIQQKIAELVNEGWTNGQIALQMGTTQGNIRNMTSLIYRKVIPSDYLGHRRVYLALWVHELKRNNQWPPIKETDDGKIHRRRSRRDKERETGTPWKGVLSYPKIILGDG